MTHTLYVNAQQNPIKDTFFIQRLAELRGISPGRILAFYNTTEETYGGKGLKYSQPNLKSLLKATIQDLIHNIGT